MSDTPPQSVGKPRRVTTALKWIVGAAVTLVVVYLAGANLLLNTGLLDSFLNRKPEKRLVQWRSGWTVVPGRVHVEGLHIRGQSRTLQWQASLAQGTLEMSLPALVTKTLKISSVAGGDFTFHARPRLEPGTKAPENARHHPQIEGLSNPPDPAPETLYSPPDPNRKRWKLDIANVSFSGPVDLWLGIARLQGDGNIGGDMVFEIGKTLEIPRAIFGIDQAEISLASAQITRDFRLDVDGMATPFDLKQTRGTEIFRHVSGELQLKGGKIEDLAAFNQVLPVSLGLDVVAGSGSFDVVLSIPDAKSARGTAAVAIQDAVFKLQDETITGDLQLDTRLAGGDLAEGTFEIGETEVKLRRVVLPEAMPETKERREKKKAEAESGKSSDGWWAEVDFTDGHVDLGQPSRVDGTIRFRMRDTEPLVRAIVALRDARDAKPPKWLRLLPDFRDLSGVAEIRLDGTADILDDVDVNGEGLHAKARLQIVDRQTDGILYVKVKGIAVGIERQGDATHLHLRKPLRWYEAQPELLPGGPAAGPQNTP